MTIDTRETLLRNVREVGQLLETLCMKYFEQSDIVGIDYLSIYTTHAAQYEEWCTAATALGAKVAEKRGSVFRLRDATTQGLISDVVRICDPGDTSLRGCGDVIPASFEAARNTLLGAGFEEKLKTLNGQDYTIIEVTDPEIGVSLYVPSMRMTSVMEMAE